MSEVESADTIWLTERYKSLRDTISKVIIGQEEAVRLSFVTLLCRGHALYEGVPGVAKTLLVRTLARTLGIRFGRIQFTADLMPSDVIGSQILQRDSGSFGFRPGPLFTDLLLADEINRAPAKTQAALLEAMQERTVTVDGECHDLGAHFTVFATQNPVEQEGTYPLPEAELDRFLFKVQLGYPAEDDELKILSTHHAEDPVLEEVPRVLDADGLERARGIASRVVVREEILAYAASLIRASRDDADVAVGASPRAGIALVRAAKALASLSGREFVLPEDVQQAWSPVLRHRVVLDPGAEVDGLTADDALASVLKRVPVPH